MGKGHLCYERVWTNNNLTNMGAICPNLSKIPRFEAVRIGHTDMVHDEIRNHTPDFLWLRALAAKQLAQRNQSADMSIPLCYLRQGCGSEIWYQEPVSNRWSLLEQMLGVRVKLSIHSWATCRTMPKFAGKKEHFFAVPPVQWSLFGN